jgi:hypothetical protein
MYFKAKYFHVYYDTCSYPAIQVVMKPCDLVEVTASDTAQWYNPEHSLKCLVLVKPEVSLNTELHFFY